MGGMPLMMIMDLTAAAWSCCNLWTMMVNTVVAAVAAAVLQMM